MAAKFTRDILRMLEEIHACEDSRDKAEEIRRSVRIDIGLPQEQINELYKLYETAVQELRRCHRRIAHIQSLMDMTDEQYVDYLRESAFVETD